MFFQIYKDQLDVLKSNVHGKIESFFAAAVIHFLKSKFKIRHYICFDGLINDSHFMVSDGHQVMILNPL